mgnify:CR=1 FL=1
MGLTYLKSHTNFNVMLGSIWNGIKSVGSSLANGLGTVVDVGADALAHIPVVGDTLSQGLGAIGDAGVEALQGNFGTALGDLYGGVDVLAGGVLPGGQAFSQGYLGNLYGAADNALNGYLPNVGGVGITPADYKLAKFGNVPGATGYGTVMAPPEGGFGGQVAGAAGKAPSFWDKAGAVANLAQTGMGIYGMMQDTPEARNAQAYQRATGTGPNLIQQPGISGGGGNALSTTVARDPAMAGTPEGKSTTGGTGGSVKTKSLSEMTDGELEPNLIKAIERYTKNNTQSAIADVSGQTAPSAPSIAKPTPVQSTQLKMYDFTPLGQTGSGYTSDIPGGPMRKYLTQSVPSKPGIPADMLMRSSLAGPRVGTVDITPSQPGIPADMFMNSSLAGPRVRTMNALGAGSRTPPPDMMMNTSLRGPTYPVVNAVGAGGYSNIPGGPRREYLGR